MVPAHDYTHFFFSPNTPKVIELLCTTLQYMSMKGFFGCNIENNEWNVATPVINLLSVLIVSMHSCAIISVGTTSATWTGDAGSVD
jgi:hypothetical protein